MSDTGSAYFGWLLVDWCFTLAIFQLYRVSWCSDEAGYIYYTCMRIPNHDVLCVTYRHTGFILEVLIHYTSLYLKYFFKITKS